MSFIIDKIQSAFRGLGHIQSDRAKQFCALIDQRLSALYKEASNGIKESTLYDLKDFWENVVGEENLDGYDHATLQEIVTKLTKWKTKFVALQKKKFFAEFQKMNQQIDTALSPLKRRRAILIAAMNSLNRGSDEPKSLQLEPSELPPLDKIDQEFQNLLRIAKQIEFLKEKVDSEPDKDISEMLTTFEKAKTQRFVLEQTIHEIAKLQKLFVLYQELTLEFGEFSAQEGRAEYSLNLLIASTNLDEIPEKCAELRARFDKLSATLASIEKRASEFSYKYSDLTLINEINELHGKFADQKAKLEKFQKMTQAYSTVVTWLQRKTETVTAENLDLINEAGFEIHNLQEALKAYLKGVPTLGWKVVDLLNHIPALKVSTDKEYKALINKVIFNQEKAERKIRADSATGLLAVKFWFSDLWFFFSNWICSLSA